MEKYPDPTIEKALNAILHHIYHPGPGPQFLQGYERMDELSEPQPSPWKIVTVLLSQISLKEIAVRLPEGNAKSQLIAGIDAVVDYEIDRCGTRWPGWHWPGPPPWVIDVVSSLGVVANTFQESRVRSEVLAVATRILQKAVGAAEQ